MQEQREINRNLECVGEQQEHKASELFQNYREGQAEDCLLMGNDVPSDGGDQDSGSDFEITEEEIGTANYARFTLMSEQEKIEIRKRFKKQWKKVNDLESTGSTEKGNPSNYYHDDVKVTKFSEQGRAPPNFEDDHSFCLKMLISFIFLAFFVLAGMSLIPVKRSLTLDGQAALLR